MAKKAEYNVGTCNVNIKTDLPRLDEANTYALQHAIDCVLALAFNVRPGDVKLKINGKLL